MKESFVAVRQYLIPTQAQLALNELLAAGISAFLSGELTANVLAGNSFLGPQLTLYARQDQMKRVLDILISLQTGLQLSDDWEESDEIMEGVQICPGCQESLEIEEVLCPYCETPLQGNSTTQ